MALVTESSARCRRTRAPSCSRVNQATFLPAATAAWPRASSMNVLPGAGRAADDEVLVAADPFQGPQRGLGGGRDRGQPLVPGVERLPGREGGPGAAGGQRGAVAAGDLLGEQRPQDLGGVPPLGFGRGDDLGRDAAHVRQPHPAQQLLQAVVERRRGRDGGGHRVSPDGRAGSRGGRPRGRRRSALRPGGGRCPGRRGPLPAGPGTRGRRRPWPGRRRPRRPGGLPDERGVPHAEDDGVPVAASRWSLACLLLAVAGCPAAGALGEGAVLASPGRLARRGGRLVGEDRGQVAVGEPARGGGLPERPVDRLLLRAGRPAAPPGSSWTGPARCRPRRPRPATGRRPIRSPGTRPRPACGPSAHGSARRAARAGSARHPGAGCPVWRPGAGPPPPGPAARHGR